jgi:hypothetical protein
LKSTCTKCDYNIFFITQSLSSYSASFFTPFPSQYSRHFNVNMILGGRWAYKKIKQKRAVKKQSEAASRDDAQRIQDAHTGGYKEAITLPDTAPNTRSTQATTCNSSAQYYQPQQSPTVNVADEYTQHQCAVSSNVQTKSPVESTLSAYSASQLSPVQREIEVRGKWIWIPEQLRAPVALPPQYEEGIWSPQAQQEPICELPDNGSIQELPLSKDSEDMTRPSSAGAGQYSGAHAYDSKVNRPNIIWFGSY